MSGLQYEPPPVVSEQPPRSFHVHTYGLMRDGKRWNDGQWMVDRMTTRKR